jgi:hypothetical protein
MATLHDPSGAIEVKRPHAPRIGDLAGNRIGFVSNEQWQAYRMLPLLKTLLEADHPGIEVLPIDGGDGGARQGERGRRRHHRQRGLRDLRDRVRPVGRQARSPGDSLDTPSDRSTTAYFTRVLL